MSRRPYREVFDEVFTEYCAEAYVPEGYRTEAVRLELLYNLEMMEADERLSRGAISHYEEPFTSSTRRRRGAERNSGSYRSRCGRATRP